MEYYIDSCLDLDDMILEQQSKTKTGFYKIRPEQQRRHHFITSLLFHYLSFDRQPYTFYADTDLFNAEQYSWKVNESNQIFYVLTSKGIRNTDARISELLT